MIQQIGVKAIIEKDNKILLLKRSEKYEHLSNAWDIPGGRINFGEEPKEGLKREIEEETGLQLKEIKQILDASTVFKNEEKHIVRITYLCTVEEGDPILSNEHTQIEWIPKERTDAREIVATIEKTLFPFQTYMKTRQ